MSTCASEIRPEVAIPIHYNTFPVIEADPEEFKKKAESAGIKVKVMEYGEELDL